MLQSAVDPGEFVRAVQPLLERQDVPGLLSLVKSRWTADQVVGLMGCESDDARKVAALAVGLVGGPCCITPLAQRLRDPDPMVRQVAEHALWTIWCRSGTPEANHELCRGSRSLDQRQIDKAIDHFTRAIELDGRFAEAYHQRALAFYLQEQFDAAIADCRLAVELMPLHFGAWATMGHAHAHLGQLPEAVESYRKAIAINPHQPDLREALRELRHRVESPWE